MEDNCHLTVYRGQDERVEKSPDEDLADSQDETIALYRRLMNNCQSSATEGCQCGRVVCGDGETNCDAKKTFALGCSFNYY